jgi:hypothetical protein
MQPTRPANPPAPTDNRELTVLQEHHLLVRGRRVLADLGAGRPHDERALEAVAAVVGRVVVVPVGAGKGEGREGAGGVVVSEGVERGYDGNRERAQRRLSRLTPRAPLQ